jgi:hypothetical protein
VWSVCVVWVCVCVCVVWVCVCVCVCVWGGWGCVCACVCVCVCCLYWRFCVPSYSTLVIAVGFSHIPGTLCIVVDKFASDIANVINCHIPLWYVNNVVEIYQSQLCLYNFILTKCCNFSRKDETCSKNKSIQTQLCLTICTS